MDEQLIRPVDLYYSAVLREAKEKYSYLNERTALLEYHDLQLAIEHQRTNNELAVKARFKRIIAAQLYDLYSARSN